MGMFYKNKGHYENTIKKVVREELGVEISFDDYSEEFIEYLYENSDRNSRNCHGYDLLNWITYSCQGFEEFKSVFLSIKHSFYDTGNHEEMFNIYGITPRREVM